MEVLSEAAKRSHKLMMPQTKLFDHAAHNGSNYLNRHCFVRVLQDVGKYPEADCTVGVAIINVP